MKYYYRSAVFYLPLLYILSDPTLLKKWILLYREILNTFVIAKISYYNRTNW